MPTVIMQIGRCKEKYTIDGRTSRIMHAKRGTPERKCKRPGCDNIIPSSFSYEVEYCSGQCGSVDKKRLNRDPGKAARESSEIIRALVETNWNKAQAARKLDMAKGTLYWKMNEYGIPLKGKIDAGNG